MVDLSKWAHRVTKRDNETSAREGTPALPPEECKGQLKLFDIEPSGKINYEPKQ